MIDSYDVAIIGGGPGGSTLGALLRKYNPELRVVILERAKFPRDHVGESQLPPISAVLEEMGVWEKVEAADFPIKIGASYTWGTTRDPWEFEFLPLEEVRDEPRPASFQGWRRKTAFQVDRAIYDKILLDHAQELGCEVREETRVTKIHHEGNRVLGLELENGNRVEADYYVDASGNAAILRRQLKVEIHSPTKLRNVAFWAYWEGAALNEDLFGHGTTRVQVRSIPFGWLWYIPLSKTRTSAGLVCPAEYYKASGKKPAELYHEALQHEPGIAKLLENAAIPSGRVETTTDWSFVAERTYGENWFLCGESLGFADPILAAGLTLTHTSGRHLAYTILELKRGKLDPMWLKESYDELQRKRVRQHMRFAEYWYSANGCFENIREYCAEIARDAGIKLSPQSAFRWLSTGGLDDEVGQAVIGGFDISALKQVQWRLSDEQNKVGFLIDNKSVFKLNLANAEEVWVPNLHDGMIERARAYRRGTAVLPEVGAYKLLLDALRQSSDAEQLVMSLNNAISQLAPPEMRTFLYLRCVQALEVMANDYWVLCSTKKGRPSLQVSSPKDGSIIYSSKLRAKESAVHTP